MNGVLVIDKPSGPTSFGVVQAVRRLARIKKVGHAGTLDPLASGLLLVCVGAATRITGLLMESHKEYLAKLQLGVVTDTLDAEGAVLAEADASNIDESMVRELLPRFVGRIEQVPPVYSAIKVGGERLYKRARRGEQVTPEPRLVTIDAIELVAMSGTEVSLRVRCGPGTYIRSLARDLGEALGVGAHLIGLRRTESGRFSLDDAVSLADLEAGGQAEVAQRLIPIAQTLRHLPQVMLDEQAEQSVRHGRSLCRGQLAPLPSAECDGDQWLLVGQGGQAVALAEPMAPRASWDQLPADEELLRPRRVFPPELSRISS